MLIDRDLTPDVGEIVDGAGSLEDGGKDDMLERLPALESPADDDVLEALPFATDEDKDSNEMAEMLELAVLELELEDELSVVFVHLMLCQFPLLSPYVYSEQGFVLVILTLLTYAVKGALVRSVYPPAQLAVAGWTSASPASHNPR